MDFVVLGALSVVLRAFGGSLGPLLSLLGSLPGTLGGFQGALGALLGALLGLFGAILTSQHVTPSFVGACSRLQEAFFKCLGSSPGALRCDFDVQTGASELQTNEKQILVISY